VHGFTDFLQTIQDTGMDAKTQPPDVATVADAIRRHLARHPRASDTAAGIQRWWVLPQLGEVSLELVEAALRRLETEGRIQCLHQAWSPTAYQAARHPPPAR
jgi:hypothetical protein